jgi:hypothetical protein
VSVSFTSSDQNYANATGSGTLIINKADSITLVSVAGGVTFTYDATAHPATVAVTGAGGLSLTAAVMRRSTWLIPAAQRVTTSPAM